MKVDFLNNSDMANALCRAFAYGMYTEREKHETDAELRQVWATRARANATAARRLAARALQAKEGR